MSSTPPPESTTPANRSCAAAACSIPACAADSAASAVGGEQDPDELAVHEQRGAADGHEALLADGGVDLGGVLVALVARVVGRPVRPTGLGDEPAESGPLRQSQGLEPRRDRARGRPHVRVAAFGVGERQVRDVRAEQAAGPPHDRVEDAAGLRQRREVARDVDQRRQLALPAAVRVDPGPHPQRELAGDRPGLRVGRRERPRLLLDPLRRGVLRQQAQQLQRGPGHGGDHATALRPASSAQRTALRRADGTSARSRCLVSP
jgi:hypothetical protein